MGTADYMAPEQVAAPQTVDIRADIYSLGCTLFKLLSGRAPYDGTDCGGTLEKLAAHTDRPVPRIAEAADVPEALAATVDRMLAKSPAARPETPAAVAAAIAPFCKGHDLAELLPRRSPVVAPSRQHATAPAAPRRPSLETHHDGHRPDALLVRPRHGLRRAHHHPPRRPADRRPRPRRRQGRHRRRRQRRRHPAARSRPLAGSTAGQFAGAAKAADEKAIQGTWAVVSQSYGGGASYFIPRDVLPHQTATGQQYDDPAQATGDVARFVFTGDTFALRGSGVWMTSGKYQINPGSEPKRIDIGKADRTNLLGIYKLEPLVSIVDQGLEHQGDRLTLCLAEKDRPTDFWPEFGSRRVLLVLAPRRRRGNPSGREGHSGRLARRRRSRPDRVQDDYHASISAIRLAAAVARRSLVPEWLSETHGMTFDKSALCFLRDADLPPRRRRTAADESASVSSPTRSTRRRTRRRST